MTAPVTCPVLKPLFRFEGFCFSFGWGRGLGGGGKNVIRTAAMPKSLAFTPFRFFAQHAAEGCGARHVSQTSMPLATMPKTLVCAALLPLCTIYCASMWNKTRCHKLPCLWRPCRKHWYLQRFAFLYSILCKDAQQDALSQAYEALAGLCRKCNGLTKFRLKSARKRCRHLGFSTVNLKKHVLFRGFLPFCLMRFAVHCAFFQGLGNVQQQAIYSICRNARRIAGAVTTSHKTALPEQWFQRVAHLLMPPFSRPRAPPPPPRP